MSYEPRDLLEFHARLDRASAPSHHHLAALGRTADIRSFQIVPESACTVLLVGGRGSSAESSIALNLQFARADYEVRMDRRNRAYMHFLQNSRDANDQRGDEDEDEDEKRPPLLKREHVQVVGVPVGDFLRHFYTTQREEAEAFAEREDEAPFPDLLRAAMRVDTLNCDVQQTLAYSAGAAGPLYLWDALVPEHARRRDFASFCKSLVYFSRDVFLLNSVPPAPRWWSRTRKALYRWQVATQSDDEDNEDTESDPRRAIAPNEIGSRRFFCALSDVARVRSLLRYHLYGEDPETHASVQTLLRFEEPACVPDVLQLLHDKYPDEKYLALKAKVARELSAHQQELLDTRYPPAVFRNLRRVPQEYPVWALRNVFVREWIQGGALCDGGACDMRNGDVMARDAKYRFRSERSGRPVAYDQFCFWRYGPSRTSWDHFRGRHQKGQAKLRERAFRAETRDGLEQQKDALADAEAEAANDAHP